MTIDAARVAEVFATMDYGPAPESSVLAEAWLDHHDCRFDHFINGAWAAPADGRALPFRSGCFDALVHADVLC